MGPNEPWAWAHEHPIRAVEYIAGIAHTEPEAVEPLIERLIEDVSVSGEGLPEAAVVLAAVAADPGERGRRHFGHFAEEAVRRRAEDLAEWTPAERAEWTLACWVLSHTGRVEAARVLARLAEEVPEDRRSVPVECLRRMGGLAHRITG
ncbi:hypothetical protein [Nocardiopsis ganjiahuensis]|uniref:hypothetical protein n=1 Tax=Nocardiopsis ganjiahuensis TaxID=239984 RepID=UPI000349EB03|nr:hypothetical protein [Nocardiopsis ganjiahuensis]